MHVSIQHLHKGKNDPRQAHEHIQPGLMSLLCAAAPPTTTTTTRALSESIPDTCIISTQRPLWQMPCIKKRGADTLEEMHLSAGAAGLTGRLRRLLFS